jgi:hypothetical protein
MARQLERSLLVVVGDALGIDDRLRESAAGEPGRTLTVR